LMIKLCSFEDVKNAYRCSPGYVPSNTEDKIFYTDDDLRDFLYRRGWICLREYESSRNVEVLDELHGGGDGLNTRFWFDTWILDLPLNVRFPQLFALELDKDISVAAKWSAPSFDASFRRQVRDGVERNQWSSLLHMLGTITLSSSPDRYICDLNGDGAYRVKDIRSELDDLFIPSSAVATRWVNLVPIKVNIFAWRVSLDRLQTREFVVGGTFNGRRSRLSLFGLLGSVLFVCRLSLKPCWRVFSTLLGGMSGPFGIDVEVPFNWSESDSKLIENPQMAKLHSFDTKMGVLAWERCHFIGFQEANMESEFMVLTAAGDDENATNPPLISPTQQAPHTLLTIKLSILKKGEYDIWAMKMEHYLGHTYYPKWEVIQKENSPDEPKVMVTIDGDGVDWTGHAEDDTKNYALMAFNSSNSGLDTEVTSCSKECEKTYAKLKKLYDEQREQLGDASIEIQAYTLALKNRSSDIEYSLVNDRFAKFEGMHAVPSPMIVIYMPLKSDFGIDESKFTYGPKQSKHNESDAKTSDLASCESNSSVQILESVPKLVESKPKAVSEPKVWFATHIIEEYKSDSDDEYVFKATVKQEIPSCAFINTVKHVKSHRQTVKDQDTCSQNPKVDKKDWTGLMSKRLGLGYGYTRKACFVCGSFSHLIRDCDFHEKRITKHVELNKSKNKVTSQRNDTPVWNNVQRLNHQNKFVTTTILTKTDRFLVNAAKQNFSTQAVSTSTVRKVNTARQIVNDIRPRDNLFKSHSPVRRPFNRTKAPKANFTNHKVNTAGDKMVSAAGGNRETAVKASAGCNWRSKRHYWNKVSKYNSGLKYRKCVDIKDPLGRTKHMTGNKAYLVEYQYFNGGPVAFGGSKGQITDTEYLVLSPDFKLPGENQVLLRVPRQNNMYSFNLENITPSGEFKNRDIIEFYASKMIKREYSNARTPQQNGVAERKNKTLIEAAKTMLGDLFLPNTFWAEAVSTACYVLNRVLVTKPQNKTPYGLITGKIPIIRYIRPFV
nr:RNA-directed DNA polymerase, eukaryota [Tanacetum cinerariifolium]